MKKSLIIILCAVMLASMAALPFLCTHASMLPEKTTEYYEKKAMADAMSATGPEAELMRMLLGISAAPEEEKEPEPLSPTLYGFFLALGACVSLAVLLYQGKKSSDLRPALLWTAALAVPLSLLGARLLYCLANLPFYLADIAAPEAMLKIWEGGLSLCGALSLGMLSGVFGAKLGKAPVSKVLDRMTAPLLLMAAFASLSAMTANTGFGPEMETAIPLLTLSMGDTLRLNTPLLTALAILLVMLFTRFSPLAKHCAPGPRFALAAFLYGGAMILMESLRRDGHMLWGFVHAEMAFDLLIALPALLYLAKKGKKLPWAIMATVLLAALVIVLEFALDRSKIGDIWLYLVYFASISAYLWLGCSCAKSTAGI